MGALVSFFAGGPARIQALLVGAGVAAAACLALLAFGLYWRGEAYQARGERDLAIAQSKVLAASVQACSAGVDQMKQVGDGALALMGTLLGEAQRLARPQAARVERIETIIHQPPQPGEGCDWAWGKIEADRKLGRP